jgi:hypothetical protein
LVIAVLPDAKSASPLQAAELHVFMIRDTDVAVAEPRSK